MPFELLWTRAARQAFDELEHAATRSTARKPASQKSASGKTGGLYAQVIKCLQLLAENPRHPGLQTHVFHSIDHPYRKGDKVFEAYVQNRTPGAYRLFWCYGPDQGQITIIAITPHP